MSHTNNQENGFWQSFFSIAFAHLIIIPGFISLILLRRNLGINVFQYIGEEKDDQVPSGLRRRIVMPFSAGLFSFIFAKGLMVPDAFSVSIVVVSVTYVHLIRWEISDKSNAEPSNYLGYGHYAPYILKGEEDKKVLGEFSDKVEIVVYLMLAIISFFWNGFLCFIFILILTSLGLRIHRNRENKINSQTKWLNHQDIDQYRRKKSDQRDDDTKGAEATFL